MASASTPSANEPAKDLILVHKVQLKTRIKAHFSGRLVSGISDVVITSVHSEKTRLKLMKMIIIIIIIIITPHAQREQGKVIGCGVHIYIYIYIYVCGRKKYLNRTLEID